jgi:hypothetical protein
VLNDNLNETCAQDLTLTADDHDDLHGARTHCTWNTDGVLTVEPTSPKHARMVHSTGTGSSDYDSSPALARSHSLHTEEDSPAPSVTPETHAAHMQLLKEHPQLSKVRIGSFPTKGVWVFHVYNIPTRLQTANARRHIVTAADTRPVCIRIIAVCPAVRAKTAMRRRQKCVS